MNLRKTVDYNSRCSALTYLMLMCSFHGRVFGEAYSSWNTEIKCTSNYPIQYPDKVWQIQQIVRKAIQLNITVKALGSRHSGMDSYCTDGIPIDMHKIAYTKLDSDSRTAKVGSGTGVGGFVAMLQRNGRAISGLVPSFGPITIGGAIATGAGASSLRRKTSLSAQIISLKFVDGSGNIRELRESSPDFSAFRVHLGLLGIVTEVTFKTVPAFKMRVENYKAHDSMLFDGQVLEMARKFDSYALHWFPNLKSVVVSQGTFVSNDTSGNASTFKLPDMSQATVLGFRAAYEKAQRLNSKVGQGFFELVRLHALYRRTPGFPPIFSENGGRTLKNPAVGYAHNLMQNTCINCLWSFGPRGSVYFTPSVFALPIEEFDGMVKAVRDILRQSPAYFPIDGINIRFSPQTDALMSADSGRETVIMELLTPMRKNPLTTARAGLAALQAISQTMVFNLHGRPHFANSGLAFHTMEMETRNYPNIKDFRAVVKKYDPNGVFLNKFGRRIMGYTSRTKYASDHGQDQVKHCALHEQCICRLDGDCAFGQKCGKLNGFNVCLNV